MKVKDIVDEEVESYGDYGQGCRIIIKKDGEQVACEYIDGCPGDIKPYMDEDVRYVQYYFDSTWIAIK